MPNDLPPMEQTNSYREFLQGDGEEREDDLEAARLEAERRAQLEARRRNPPSMKPYLP